MLKTHTFFEKKQVIREDKKTRGKWNGCQQENSKN
jgi:hypothetical protein